MNHDLDVDEHKATACPRDWVIDFDQPKGYTLHACGRCNSTFRSLPTRDECWKCKEGS